MLASINVRILASKATSTIGRPSLSIINGVNVVSRRHYHENIVEHYENPRNVGSLDKTDSMVGTVSEISFSRIF